MKIKNKKILINKINQSLWWHVTPKDFTAYKKRGKFFASTYKQAEFYGRPNDGSERIKISNPIYGTSGISILKVLFPIDYKKLYTSVMEDHKDWYKRRIKLDSKMYRKAKSMGYDAIVLLGNNANGYLMKNRKPYSIEVNLCK
ncbi:MAG: hypothetical protein UX68_C0012G0032 [Parcubacteria group bacterium GW2011_GWA2_46_9]|nr:MAG: hypothetical protein UX68_C0012G0032 [Parcubacteria group bacterium GW2011_GWA2_46_9]